MESAIFCLKFTCFAGSVTELVQPQRHAAEQTRQIKTQQMLPTTLNRSSQTGSKHATGWNIHYVDR